MENEIERYEEIKNITMSRRMMEMRHAKDMKYAEENGRKHKEFKPKQNKIREDELLSLFDDIESVCKENSCEHRDSVHHIESAMNYYDKHRLQAFYSEGISGMINRKLSNFFLKRKTIKLSKEMHESIYPNKDETTEQDFKTVLERDVLQHEVLGK